MKRVIWVFFALVIFPASVFAAINCQEGTDYTVISTTSALNAENQDTDTISVIEFFNYACPACNTLEPSIERLQSTLPEDVSFSRVPVVFSRSPVWEVYARAYYLAEALGKEQQISPALFRAVHEQRQNLADNKALVNFFNRFDVTQAQVESALTHSPAMDERLKSGEALMRAYSINAVPSIVVNGQYKTDMGQAGGPAGVVGVVNCLIDKSRQD